jgi:hypothetical protein
VRGDRWRRRSSLPIGLLVSRPESRICPALHFARLVARACANTTLRMDTFYGSSLSPSWPSFGNRAVYGLILTGISTASLRDEVVAFDFTKGACLGTTVQFRRLNGQALAFFP